MHNRTTAHASAIAAGVLLALFAALTVSLVFVDRQPIAGDGSLVGLATFNLDARAILGQNDLMEKLSNALLIVPAVGALMLAIVGCKQLIRSRKPRRGRSRSLAVAGNLRRHAGAIRAVQLHLAQQPAHPGGRRLRAVVPLVAHAACRHHVRHGHDPGRATASARGAFAPQPGHAAPRAWWASSPHAPWRAFTGPPTSLAASCSARPWLPFTAR